MPRSPQEEESISRSVKMPEEPRRPVSGSRKWLLVLVMFFLGIPVFLVMLAPPVTGGWILWQQYALFREDGRWRDFSLFELATLTVDERLAASLRWPAVGGCGGFREIESSGPDSGPSEQASQECPQLGPWQSWLLHPTVLLEWHGRVSRIFRFLPVSGLLFLLGLILSFLLRLFGANWRLRSAPPTPHPMISAAVPREVISRPPEAAEPKT